MSSELKLKNSNLLGLVHWYSLFSICPCVLIRVQCQIVQISTKIALSGPKLENVPIREAKLIWVKIAWKAAINVKPLLLQSIKGVLISQCTVVSGLEKTPVLIRLILWNETVLKYVIFVNKITGHFYYSLSIFYNRFRFFLDSRKSKWMGCLLITMSDNFVSHFGYYDCLTWDIIRLSWVWYSRRPKVVVFRVVITRKMRHCLVGSSYLIMSDRFKMAEKYKVWYVTFGRRLYDFYWEDFLYRWRSRVSAN